jgi:hypothetical protein
VILTTTVTLFSKYLFWSTLLVWLYAELHYPLPVLRGILYKKEPEIIFDTPFRVQSDHLPVLLLIKDAHWFPIGLLRVEIQLLSSRQQLIQRFSFEENLAINAKWFGREYHLDIKNLKGQTVLVHCQATVQVGRKVRQVINDNYPQVSHAPFTVYLDPEPLPTVDGLIWGEMHAHTRWTEDQVEFGVPPEHYPSLGKAMGLHFTAILEHSYDLDDRLDSWTKTDPALPKWHEYQATIAALNRQNPDFCLIPGEEVSVDNGLGENVHLGVVNSPQFFWGMGDCLERRFGYPSELHYRTVVEQLEDDALAFAAHPFYKPPLSHRLIIRRNVWNYHDRLGTLMGFQLINGKLSPDVFECLAVWRQTLLEGYHFRLLAGNDAHGNFNRFRQLIIPFFKMHEKASQIYAEFITGVAAPKQLNPSSLVQALKTQPLIVSNGPALTLKIAAGGTEAAIGAELVGKPQRLHYHFCSSNYLGHLKNLRIFLGNLVDRQELLFKEFDYASGMSRVQQTISLADLPARGYFRAEGQTRTGKVVFTNPVWYHST